MKQRNKIALNVISSGLQVIGVGIVYFFLYKFLLHTLSVEMLGVWSVVLATSSIANMANFGISASVIRFIAIYTTDKNEEMMQKLIFTSSFFLTGVFVIFSLILYPFASFILKFVIDPELVKDALALLPYSILCLIINALSGVYSSVLDGLQKNYIRSLIVSTSSVLLLLFTYYFTPKFGLTGVAFAQIAQSVFSLLMCLIVVVVKLKYNPFRWNWNKAIFKEIFSYGLNFQAISITAMFNEPLIKGLLAKFGGLAYTGYYEMASRLVSQVRGVVVGATQSLIPILIEKEKEGEAQWNAFYNLTFKKVFVYSLLFMSSIVLFSNVASIIWIGHDEPIFNTVVLFLSISTFINLICTPAYFSCIAEAKMRILIISHFTASIINILFGYICGYYLQGLGILISWITASSISSFYILIEFHSIKKISAIQIIGRKFAIQICIFILIFSMTKAGILNYSGQIHLFIRNITTLIK